MDTTGLCMNMMRALTRIWREENDAAERMINHGTN